MFDARLIEDEQTAQQQITGSGSIVSFDSAFVRPLDELKVNIAPTQSGEGDPSPTNIRPISGWTGCEVTRTGKNTFDQSNTSIIANDARAYAQSDAMALAQINMLPAGTYTLSFHEKVVSLNGIEAVPTRFGLFLKAINNDNSQVLDVNAQSSLTTPTVGDVYTISATFTLTDAFVGKFQYFYVYTGKNAGASTPNEYTAKIYDVQIERSFTATAYEPYLGQTYPITWSDTAGTVYGGTLDAVSGKLTVNRKDILLSSLTWQRRGVRLFSANLPSGESADPTVPISEHLCDTFLTEYVSSYTSTQALHLALYKSVGAVVSGTVYLRLTSAEISDSTAEFNQWLIDNPVHLCYKLATPIEYDITPTEIDTLLGANNIWADCGDVSLRLDAVRGKLQFSLVK